MTGQDGDQLSERHEEALYNIAKWMRAHGERYAPVSCVTRLSEYRILLKDLKKWGLIGYYKSGKAVFPTEYGWLYIIEKHPELARRGGVVHYE